MPSIYSQDEQPVSDSSTHDLPPDHSDTASLLTLTPSLRADLYRVHQSRRYQAVNTDYPLPCDAVAARSELLTHRIYGKTWANGLYYEAEHRRVEELMCRGEDGEQRRVLDVGSGTTASWIIAMAERFPGAMCVGVDLIPSDLPYVPSNLDLEIHDVLEGLPYPDDYFTLIHTRELTCLAQVYSPSFFAEVARCLRPSGILLIEEVEADSLHTCPLPSPTSPHLPLDPRFKLAQERSKHHIKNVLAARPPVDPAFRANRGAETLRSLPGFKNITEVRPTFSIGARSEEEAGPVEEQRGQMVREAVLCAWSLGAATVKNASQAWMEEVAELDRAILPEGDVGLTMRSMVLWAEKEGG